MHGREEGHTRPGEQRQGEPVDMAVDDVEVGGAPPCFEQDRLHGRSGQCVACRGESVRPHWLKLGARGNHRGEQGDVVAKFDEFVD